MQCHEFLLLSAVLGFVARTVSSQGTEYNEINPDGSFSFGLKTNDFGGHYHEATGSPKSTVRGRFGSRNPATNTVEETVYTAGRRGFRARGPTIHRQMDLSQVPRGPIGTPDDPNADPFEDPSYGFGFKTPIHSRREDQDRFRRLNGMYTYVDDVGERHLVKYTGSAQNGFEVTNSFPDPPQAVHYSRSLYKDGNPKARGRMAMQRKGPSQYSFIAAAPDHRRSESIGPDGITRGSYSYLDDKGVQRTVQYIAGAGIGYRVVQTTTGPGTHNLLRPAAPQFGVFSQQSNDMPAESLFFDDSPNRGFSKDSGKSPGEEEEEERRRGGGGGGGSTGPSSVSRGVKHFDENEIPVYPSRRPSSSSSSSSSGSSGSSFSSSSSSNKGRDPWRERKIRPFSGPDPNEIIPDFVRQHPRYPPTPTPPTPPRNQNRRPSVDLRPTAPPLNPYPEYFGVNSLDFDKAHIRAHVQNIDLLPISPRYPSPGEALKWDIISGN